MTARGMWLAGCLLAGLAVAAGAFGVHALRDRLGPDLLAAWETAARYQMYHALALLVVAGAAVRRPEPAWGLPAALLVAGILLFSGSLYALALSGVRPLGMITPLGGACWLAAWLLLARAGARALSSSS
jgi:uncharacterized membrane protein YgdD (TMEM256/DUF423 family)